MCEELSINRQKEIKEKSGGRGEHIGENIVGNTVLEIRKEDIKRKVKF